ncbi:putative RNA-directed DNA polymerase, partial [Aphis craccivora]
MQAEINPPVPKLINRPIKWEIFKEKIDKILKPSRKYSNTNDINSGITHLTESIKSAIDLALAPPNYKKSQNYNTPIPFYIQSLIKEKHKARRIWQTHRSPAVKKRLNQLTRRVKWELDNLRYNSYKAYVSKISPNDSSLWIATKRITKQHETIPPLKNGLAKYETNIEKCEIFAQYFERCFTTDDNHTNQNEIIDLEQRNIEDQPI